MKKKLLGFLLGAILVSMCIGCNAESANAEQHKAIETTVAGENISKQTVETTATPEVTEAPTPEVPKEPSEEIAPEVEMPEATSEPTTESVPEPQVVYTYTDMSATMYATQTVNVRNLPSTDGEKVGSLNTNQEITVTGQCNETGWYMFDYNGQTAFVSNDYLSTEKAEVTPPAQETAKAASNVPNPYDYPVSTWIDMGDWFFYVHPALESPEPNVNGALWEDVRAILQERYPDKNISGRSGMKLDNGTHTAWLIAVGGTNSYDYPQALIDFIAAYQY